MADKIFSIENHTIVTLEHEMRVEDHFLSEKKQKTTIEPADPENGPTRIIMNHLRCIDGQCIVVSENFSNGQNVAEDRKVETDMTEDEVKQFEEAWLKYWKPEITKKDVENLNRQ